MKRCCFVDRWSFIGVLLVGCVLFSLEFIDHFIGIDFKYKFVCDDRNVGEEDYAIEIFLWNWGR